MRSQNSLSRIVSKRKFEEQLVTTAVVALPISHFSSQTALDADYRQFLTDLRLQREKLSTQPQLLRLFDQSWW
jgi:hypothetical protein